MSQREFADEANAAVKEASDWVRWIVQRESRGNGDRKNAMDRLSRRYPGLTKGLLFNLLYRPSSDMLLSKWLAVRGAYLAECERHERALRLQREKTDANTLLGETLLRAADRLAGQSDRDLRDQ